MKKSKWSHICENALLWTISIYQILYYALNWRKNKWDSDKKVNQNRNKTETEWTRLKLDENKIELKRYSKSTVSFSLPVIEN